MRTVLIPLVLAFVLGFTDPVSAAETQTTDRVNITTVSGATYTNCKITRTDPDGITVMHGTGITKIPFTDLSGEDQTSYGYDQKEAEEYSRTMTENRARKQAAEMFKDAAGKYAVLGEKLIPRSDVKTVSGKIRSKNEEDFGKDNHPLGKGTFIEEYRDSSKLILPEGDRFSKIGAYQSRPSSPIVVHSSKSSGHQAFVIDYFPEESVGKMVTIEVFEVGQNSFEEPVYRVVKPLTLDSWIRLRPAK